MESLILHETQWEPKGISRAARDVLDSKKTSLSSFLVMFLARLSLNIRMQPFQESIEAEDFDIEASKKLLDDILRDAALFCNNKKGQNARKFSRRLHT